MWPCPSSRQQFGRRQIRIGPNCMQSRLQLLCAWAAFRLHRPRRYLVCLWDHSRLPGRTYRLLDRARGCSGARLQTSLPKLCLPTRQFLGAQGSFPNRVSFRNKPSFRLVGDWRLQTGMRHSSYHSLQQPTTRSVCLCTKRSCCGGQGLSMCRGSAGEPLREGEQRTVTALTTGHPRVDTSRSGLRGRSVLLPRHRRRPSALPCERQKCTRYNGQHYYHHPCDYR